MGELTPEQREALARSLAADSETAETTALIEARFAAKATCPHCQGDGQKWGFAAGLRRYRCRSCKTTFNALTGTPLASLKKRQKLAAYGQAMVDGLSLRKAAKRVGINLSTAFDWRHRLLKLPAKAKPKTLDGVVEADETYILESEKGSRKLKRKARKRGGTATKRGLSHEQIPVLVTRDRSGATLTEVLPDTTAESIAKVLGSVVAKDAALVSDGAKAYRTFADASRPAAYRAQCQRRRAHVGHLSHPERQRLPETPQGLARPLQGRGDEVPRQLSRLAPVARARERRLHPARLHCRCACVAFNRRAEQSQASGCASVLLLKTIACGKGP